MPILPIQYLGRSTRSGGLVALLAASVILAAAPDGAGQGRGQGQPQGQGQPPRGGRGSAPVRDPQGAADTPAGTGSIAGTIVVAGTGAPARRARVTLSGDPVRGGRSTTTDDRGRYAFGSLPAGRFTLSASKAGHLEVTYGQRVPGSGRPGTPIQLEDGQRLNIQLQMPRGGVISGTVLDEEGEAVPGTQVRAFRYSLQGGVRTLQSAGTDATDDRGMYRIYGLQIGDYVVCATPRSPAPPGFEQVREAVASLQAAGQIAATIADRINSAQGQPGSDDPAPGYAPVYYPGTTITANATAVPLGVSEEKLGVDFQLQLVPMARVEGLVIYPAGQEPGGLQVQLVNISSDLAGAVAGGLSARADRDGRFRFTNVPPGQYTLIARTGGPGGMIGPRGGGPGPAGPAQGRGNGRGDDAPRLWASADISVDGRNLSNVALTLQPGFSIAGRLEFRGTTTQAPTDLTRMRVTLVPADTSAAGRQLTSAAAGRVDDAGHFTIDGVIPGRYRISAGGPGGWQLDSAVIGGQDAVDVPLDIRASQNLSGAVVTFTDQQTTVSGAATNAQGQAVSDYSLIVYPSDSRYWAPQSRRIRSVRPATDGTFSLSGLPAGDYRVAPVLDPEPGSWFDAAFLQQLDGASERFTLADGEKKVQNVRVGGG